MKYGAGQPFLRALLFSSLTIFPSMLHLHFRPIKRISQRSLRTFRQKQTNKKKTKKTKKNIISDIGKHWTEKYFHAPFPVSRYLTYYAFIVLFCHEGNCKADRTWCVIHVWHSAFGGLEAACWPLVPGRSRRIFHGEKFLSTPSFWREVKPFVPCRRFKARKRSLNVTWKSGIFRQNS